MIQTEKERDVAPESALSDLTLPRSAVGFESRFGAHRRMLLSAGEEAGLVRVRSLRLCWECHEGPRVF